MKQKTDTSKIAKAVVDEIERRQVEKKTDTSKIAKAVVDEIERRQVENEPLSSSASIWFMLCILILMTSILIIIIYLKVL